MRHVRGIPVACADGAMSRSGQHAPGAGCPLHAGPDGGGRTSYCHVLGKALPEDLPSAESIRVLADAMKARPYRSRDGDIPAGYTYLGQFIFHDITAMMPGPSPTEPRNARSPELDLDSVLPGRKPADAPELCSADGLFRIGVTTELPRPDDIPRDWRRPLIADARNDDFLPLSQTHLLLLKFYNAVARHLGHDGSDREDGWWDEVRRVWLQHFQSVVLFDYLPRIVDTETFRDVMENGRRLVRADEPAGGVAWLPIEFAAAAGRFGHSMIRQFYHPWSRPLSWTVVTVNDFIRFSHANAEDGLSQGVSFHWATDWPRMFDLGGRRPPGEHAPAPIRAMAIDTHLAPQLHALPSRLRSDMADAARNGAVFSLAASTMLRGREMMLSSGQAAVAAANEVLGGALPVLAPQQIFDAQDGLVGVAETCPELAGATPLWFYLLREAELLARGRRLGPLGGRIVMETLHASIDASPDSILRGTWRPSLPSRRGDAFDASDMTVFSLA